MMQAKVKTPSGATAELCYKALFSNLYLTKRSKSCQMPLTSAISIHPSIHSINGMGPLKEDRVSQVEISGGEINIYRV